MTDIPILLQCGVIRKFPPLVLSGRRDNDKGHFMRSAFHCYIAARINPPSRTS